MDKNTKTGRTQHPLLEQVETQTDRRSGDELIKSLEQSCYLTVEITTLFALKPGKDIGPNPFLGQHTHATRLM